MADYNKNITATSVRLGELRFSYAYVFSPRRNEDGSDGKYSVQLLIPKTDKDAKRYIDAAVEAAKQVGATKCWNGKVPPAAKLHLPLRDGDEENPDDPIYEGMWFMNAGSKTKPGVRVLENGQMSEAMDVDDFYSGCWGAAVVNFFPYSTSGNMGVAAGLNNVIKTRDDERLGGGGRSAETDFGDMVGEGGSFLD